MCTEDLLEGNLRGALFKQNYITGSNMKEHCLGVVTGLKNQASVLPLLSEVKEELLSCKADM